jgi:transposase
MAGSPLSAPREMRFRWYRQVEQYNKKVEEVCEIFGISRKTYYKWYRRDHGLEPGQRKPRKVHPHIKITGKVRARLVDAKQTYNYGPKKMSIYLKEKTGKYVAPSTIYKFYKRRGLIQKPQKKQKWYTPMKEPYVASKPGENVQLDVKYVPSREGGWAYQYRFIDTVTNLQYARTMRTRAAKDTIKALHGAKRSFPFEIGGVQTDNGGEFRGVFHEYLIQEGIMHRYIPKRSAPWNGKVERANRSVDDEYYLNYRRPWKNIRGYTHWYNHERPHLGNGMNGMTPYQKFLSLTG